jgi:hypothetical protein
MRGSPFQAKRSEGSVVRGLAYRMIIAGHQTGCEILVHFGNWVGPGYRMRAEDHLLRKKPEKPENQRLFAIHPGHWR